MLFIVVLESTASNYWGGCGGLWHVTKVSGRYFLISHFTIPPDGPKTCPVEKKPAIRQFI
jgi:hypothetical protein